jgi:hypothetical protein
MPIARVPVMILFQYDAFCFLDKGGVERSGKFPLRRDDLTTKKSCESGTQRAILIIW